MNDFTAHSFLAHGATTKAGDNAASERVLLADSITRQRSAEALKIVRKRNRRRAMARSTAKFVVGVLVVFVISAGVVFFAGMVTA